MRENGCHSSVKEVENSIVNVLKSGPQFIDPIAEQVGFRPTEFVTEFRQPLNSDPAFVLCSRWKTIEPFQDRHRAVCLAIEYELGPGHADFFLADFAKMRKVVQSVDHH